MRILLDTNVVLDAMLLRQPWAAEAAEILRAADEKRIECHLTASAVTDVFYLASRVVGRSEARRIVRFCLEKMSIVGVDSAVIESAFMIPIDDLEDALQVACAARSGLDAIVTRDERGFFGSPVPVHSPAGFLGLIGTP
jgi:predicted nucleic acid-binding protein